MMKVRLPFAGVFFVLLLLAAYLGLSSLRIDVYINDKVLHFLIFFLLTVAFYWIVDTNRRRTLNLTLVVCTLGLAIGSEFVQDFLPNDRDFDPWDILGNIAGSLAGLGLCSWYHKRMLDRRRERKVYSAVPGEEGDDVDDLESGIGLGLSETDAEEREDGGLGLGSTTIRTTENIELATRAPAPQSAATSSAASAGRGATGAGVGAKQQSLEEEVDNWDENAEDAWDDADAAGEAAADANLASKKHED